MKKNRLVSLWLASLALLLCVILANSIWTEDSKSDGMPKPYEATGKEFILKDNPAFPNVEIRSSVEIHIQIEAISSTLGFYIIPIPADSQTETTLTISGLEKLFPNTEDPDTVSFNHYQDGYLHEEVTIKDNKYTYIQSLKTLHHVYFMPANKISGTSDPIDSGKKDNSESGTPKGGDYFAKDGQGSGDTTPPVISNLNPEDDSTITNTMPTISADFEDPELFPGWDYRVPITITNSSAVTLTNFQVLITPSYTAGMQADFDDLRFTDTNIQELSYWLESKVDSTSAAFWVKVPSIPAQSNAVIYMYYGNSSATSTSNGDNTFEFFDDFTATPISSTKWNTINSGLSYSISNSIFHAQGYFWPANGDGAFRGYQSTTTYGLGYAMRARVLVDHGQGSSYNMDEIGFGKRYYPPTPNCTCFVDLDNSGGDSYGAVLIADGSGEGIANWNQSTQYNIWDFIRKPNQEHRAIIGALLDQTFTTITPNNSLPITLGAAFWGSWYGFYDYYVDYTLVRKCADTDPTVSFGTEQNIMSSGINPDSALMLVDDITVTVNAATYGISYTPTAPLYSGQHDAYVYVEDNDGNPVTATWSFTIQDITPPIIYNLTPASNSTVSNIIPAIGADYDDGSFRKPITITNSGDVLTYYQVPVDLTTAIYDNTGIKGSWHFSEGTGAFTQDMSGNSNNGTLTNGPTWTTGKFGKGLNFDGSDDYVNITPAGSLTGIYTVAVWAKVSDNATRSIFSTRTPSDFGFDMKFMDGNKIHADIGNGSSPWITTSADATFNYQTDTWYYVVYVVTQTGYSIYVNGTQAGSGSYASNTPLLYDSNHNIHIGYYYAGNPEAFNGTIDEVKIYNRVLSGTEISDQYTASKARLDYADIRFSTDTASCPYWLESDIKAWVNVPVIAASSTTTIYMYYGNPGVTSASNGDNTFLFFDDFSGNLSKWSGDTASFSVSGGELSNTPSETGMKINHDIALANTVLTARIKTTDASTNFMWGLGYRIDASNRTYFCRRHYSGYERRWGDGTTYWSNVPPQWTSGVYGIDSIIVKSTVASSLHYFNGTLVTGETDCGLTMPLGVTIYSYGVGTPGAQYMDLLYVRKYASAEPSISIGEEEIIPSGSGVVSSTASISLDGVDKTNQADITDYGISYTPSSLSYGEHTVVVSVADYENNVATATWTFSFADTIAPTGSVVINNGASVTTSTSVTLTLYAVDTGSGVSLMNISNGSTSTNWITYASSCTCYLGSELGTKTITVQYKDYSGNVSEGTISDTIVLAYDHQNQSWDITDGSIPAYGIHYNVTDFTVPSGTYTIQGTTLEVNARNIYITGTLSANGKGYGPGEGEQNGEGKDGGTANYFEMHWYYYYGAGGGGGHGGKGGKGGNLWTASGGDGGLAYGNPISPTEPGSGGGASSGGVTGGAGGGVIYLKASETISIPGSVSADGDDGINGYDDYGESIYLYGGGGGGAAGSIWMFAKCITGTGSINANGGNGGSSQYPNGGGGGGGGGLISLQYSNNFLPQANITVTKGSAGTGGEDGDAGLKAYNGKIQESANDVATGGDPIYLATGEFYQETTDLTIPGRGFPFRFTRKYRAQSWYNGPLGYGWDFNYNARIEKIDNDLNYYDGMGRIDKYTWNSGQGKYLPPDGFYNGLTYDQQNERFTLTERDGTKYTFIQNTLNTTLYVLSSITDRNNNSITCTYDASYRMDSVIDTREKVISFYYTADSRIDYFEDWENRRVDFTYDSNGDLVSVRSPVTTEYPNGKTTQYTYTSGQLDIRMNHKLLTVTDPKGQTYLTNVYDERGRVITQTYGSGIFTNEYYDATESEPAVVRVTDRNGNVTDSWLSPQGNVITETKYSNGIMPEDITTTYEHITTTERSVTIFPNGNSTEYLYDKDNSNPKAKGNLLEVRRKASGLSNIVISYTYETHYNQVKTSIDAKGKTTVYYYDWEEIQDSTDYNGDSQLGPDHGNVVKIVYPTVTLPDSSQQSVISKFWYNNNGQITHAIDPENIDTYYEYYTTGASTGYLKKVTRNYGASPNAVTEYEYDSVGNITGITDARGHKTTFTVNELNQVTQSTARAPFSYQVKFHYDANDNLTQTEVQNKDENGNTGSPEWISTYNGYDMLNNIQTITNTISTTETAITNYARDNNENLTTVTLPENNQNHTTYDERDRVYQSTAGYGSANPVVTINYYDLNGNLTETRIGDGSKGTVYCEYDGFDRRVKVKDQIGTGNYTQTDYDENSNVTRIRRYDSSGNKLSDVYYDYDELNRLWQIRAQKFDGPGQGETEINTVFWYDKKGRRTKVVNDKSKEVTTVYDNLDRVTSVTDPLNNEVEYTYDDNGNPLTVTETEYPGPTTYVTANEYDNLDRLISSTNWAGTSLFKYDSRNNNKHSTDRENHITRRDYDLASRLKENIYELATGNISVKYGLDKNGRLVTLTDDNDNITEYEYDEVNRRKKEILPDTSEKNYTFNQYGALYQMTDNNGSVVTHSYDNALRLSGKTISRATGVYGTTYENFGYDGMGRMTSAQNDDSTVAMSYDSFSNILTETQNNKTVTSAYDVLSFRTSLTYPGNKAITLEPDDLNRIYQIKDASSNIIAGYSYAGPGRVTGRSYYNGTSLSVTYDDGRRAITYTHGATIGGFGYSFDKMNNKLYENRTFNSKGEAFKYDEIYRLTGVKYGVPNLSPATNYADYSTYDSVENYDLDGVGNRLEVGNGTVSTTYTANALNQYSQISDTEITALDYDLNGNLRWDGVITCTYNYANQLIKVIRSDDEQILGEYKYDVLGRRIYKKAWNGTAFVETYLYYDGSRCIEERNSSDSVIATYVFGNGVDEVLTMERDSQTYYYHENSLGSIYAVTTSTGNTVERYSYDAYGYPSFYDASGTPITNSLIANHLLFTGREFDEETGLYYYRVRYYSAEQGRFLGRDPAADDGLLNLYAYVENDPINCIDPFGLWKIKRDKTMTRGTVTAEPGDTYKTLDAELAKRGINLSPDERNLWLKTSKGEAIPDCPSAGESFTFPNTVHVMLGNYKDTFGFLGAAAFRVSEHIRKQAEDEGFCVMLETEATKQKVKDALSDANIYGFAFFGHGDDRYLRATDGTISAKDDIPEARKNSYELGKVILNSCGSDTFKQTFFPDLDTDSKFERRGEFKGHYSTWGTNMFGGVPDAHEWKNEGGKK